MKEVWQRTEGNRESWGATFGRRDFFPPHPVFMLALLKHLQGGWEVGRERGNMEGGHGHSVEEMH